MSFDYFYGQQSDLFTFYRVPKVLFTNERFWNISADAKMLYGILLDRMSLSAKNGWIDKNGRVYIIFTIDEAKMALNCAEQKAIKLLSELEKKAGLIERKRQGLGKPNLIYVKNFISAVDSQLLNCENHNSGTMEITTQELPKSQCNNTDIKNTEFSDTDSIFPSGNGGMMDENDRYQEYFDYFSDQLSMDSILMSSHITTDLEKVADYITFIHQGKVLFCKTKDELRYNYGIIRCGAALFDQLDKAEILAYRKDDYQWNVLVADKEKARRKYKNAVVDDATIDDILLLYVKGEQAK